ASAAVARGAAVLSRVEDRALDAVWLGLSVTGTPDAAGVDRSARVRLEATHLQGPGRMAAYLTDTFGGAQVYVAGHGDELEDGHSALLRPDAHTHMSWAFTEPGVYRLTLEAALEPTDGPAVPVATTELTFAVGVDPFTVPGARGADVLDAGHADLTVDLDRLGEGGAGAGPGPLVLVADAHGPGGDHDHAHSHDWVLDPTTTVIAVPPSSLLPLPSGAESALGDAVAAGDPVYQLPQAVLGRHLHGQIDPFLWLDVRNAQVYVEIVRDTLIEVDPQGAEQYRRNAAVYLADLEELDREVSTTVDDLPRYARHLVTTYDSFAYLATAYGLRIVGSLAPDRGSDPGLRQRRQLTRTVATMELPAVFLEVGLDPRASVLRELASDAGVAVCPLYLDTLDDDAPDYVSMMRANAESLHQCLSYAIDEETS
ncbi:ABC transporter substrate-binding protein, partial [Cellulomonas bogoriensis 69B4 = DSM 16987]